jgi:quinol monooxygenase YgiN
MSFFLSRRGFALLSLTTLLTGTGCASTSNRSERMERQGAAAENIHTALLVRLEAKPGQEAEVRKFLEGGRAIVQGEPATVQWFALRFGPTSFGIFDTFADEPGRQAHLHGQVAAALGARASELLAEPPSIAQVDVLATKAPSSGAPDVNVALVALLDAKPGKEAELQKFLEDALPIVRGEPETTHWYAIRLSPTRFGIVDTFAKDSGRQAHLQGQVAAALGARASELLAQPPSIAQVDVLAAKP